MKDKIDVIMPVYNRAEDTFLTVEALLETNDNVRLIIVYDGCTEKPDLSNLDTGRIIQISLPRVGQPKAINIAYRLVESEYIVIMHNDIIIKDVGWINKAVNFLKANKEAGLVCVAGHNRVWTDETHHHVQLVTSVLKHRNINKMNRLFEVIEPKEDFTEIFRADGIVSIFKGKIEADERYGISGTSFWIDILAKGLKNYAMKLDNAKHFKESTLELYPEAGDIGAVIKNHGKWINIRVNELGLRYPKRIEGKL